MLFTLTERASKLRRGSKPEGRFMNTVAQILGTKPDQTVYTMKPSASAHEAVRLMAEKNIGALVVVEHGNVVGLVSERDYARKLVLMARSPRDTLLGDIMSSPVMYVRPHQTSDECMALMTENRLRHLPVIMVTSRTGAKHRALASDAGCNAYMGKPFNFPALIKQINELTGHDLQLS